MKMPASSTRPLHVTLLLSLLLIVLPSSRALTERETLNQFFADTAGVQWLSRDSWASAAPICSWYGVTCNNPSQDYGVIALELPSNNVARKITPQLYQLPDLKVLSLQGNPIEDASFEGLGLVSEDTTDRGTPSPLEAVDLSDCLLRHVDGLRFAADTLTQLRLAKNQLAYFPSDVYSLTMLQKLYVNFNPMQGPLSKAIGQLTDLTEFYAYSGSLTGTLPTEIGLLDKVQIFTLANNRFSGTIPSEVNNMLNLEVFSLHGGTAADDATGNGAPAQPVDATGLTGPVPSFARAPRLGKLFLADNALTGRLPDDFLEHNQLIDDYILINLRNNRLTGGIPAVLRVFNQLNIDLVGNQLSEPIPNYMCTRSQWMNGLVNAFGCDAILCHAGSYNEQGQQTSDETPCSACPPAGPSANEPASLFLGASTCPGARDGPSEVGGGTSTDSGGLPTVDPARVLMNLYLQTDGPRWEQNSGWDILDVFLSTSIDMSQVPLDDVDYCRFYGVFCDGQGNVQILSLANNRLRGTIPPDLFRLNRLVSVDLSFNRIDLDFSRPASQGGGLAVLENAPYLERLKLSHTSITRVDGISQGISLTGLYLDGTDLEQPLPDEIYALTNLDTLHMEAAYLVGNLSTKIGLLSNLKRLNLNENEIGGDLPSELGLLTSCEYLDLSDNDFAGVLPAELNSMSSLWSLRINGARGGLGGRLLAFESLPNVRELELAYNVLTGLVPPNFLAGTDRANPLTVRLTGNNLGGSLPEDLQTFTDFTIEVEDNQITGIPPVLCAQTGWQNGEVGRVPGGCNAILCPPLSWSPHGKASPTLNLLCEDCPGNAFFGETVCESGEVTLSREREILDELFFSTGGRYWNKTQTNWTKPGIPICNREGIDCIGDDQPNSGVYQIFLSNYGLRGTVPTSIYELPSLRRLAISWNPVDVNFAGIGGAASLETVQLSGTKVDSLEGIENASTRLVELHIAKAGIEGAFPPQLLEARSLTALYLSGNRITGRIPSEIGQMNLNLLHLDGNELTGPVPTELGMLSSMIELRLQDNQIMGLIPSELGTMSDLKEFDISRQRGELQLTGPLYPFANNSKLVKLNLSGNSFAGLLPKNFLWSVDKTASIQADLSDNLIAGGIPSEYDAFQQLTINVAQNMIDMIPAVLCDNIGWMGGSPPGVDTCDFILCAPQFASSTGRATVGETCRPCPYAGQAPFFGSTECDIAPLDSERDVLVEFYQAAGGDDWVFNENWNSILNVCTWYGVICTEDFSVVELRLENNHLQNENSDTDIIGLLGRLANLRTIDLKGNSLSLALVGLPATSSLQTLRLSSTSLASLAGVSNARNLTSLHAVDCGLTGAFPEEIFDMQNLVEIYLSFNTLNGTLPSAIGSMQKLEQLILYGNSFTGTLPEELTNLNNLRELVLGKNSFWGPLPNGLSSMVNLEQLSLQDQQGRELIDGKLPDFSPATNLWYLDLSNNDLTGAIPVDFLAGRAQSDNRNASIMILLGDNDLTGSLPTGLKNFEDLFIDVAGNRIQSIPSVLCQKSKWMYGAVGDIGSCDAILCPAGFYSDSGRQDSLDEPCRVCPVGEAQFLGQTLCQVFESEREILQRLFDETGGSSWVKNQSWGTNDPLCSWQGVTCVGDLQDEEGVESIDLSFNGLVGTSPSDIWSLPQLLELSLRGNDQLVVHFVGMSKERTVIEILDLSNTRVESLEGLEDAVHVKELYLDETGLSGTFPSEVFEIYESLERLHLSWNMLIGTIPSAIDRLSTLTEFNIAGNDFHGTLPTGIGYLANLVQIRMDETLLSGVLPATELSYLPRLQSISASRSAKSGRTIVGALPPFDKAPALESLFLDGNSLSGSIPKNFLSASIFVREVVITDNELTGALPLELDTLEQVNFEVAGNMITSLPHEFCDNEGWMRGLVAKFNNSCDAILCEPGTFGRFGRTVSEDEKCLPCDNHNAALSPYWGSTDCRGPADQRAILSELFFACQGGQWYRNDYWTSKADVCDWHGIGCDNGQVVLINLDANNLRGNIPSSLFRLPKLQVLWLNSNRVSIDFSNIHEAENLLDLRLDSTGLRDVEGIGEARSLTALSLAFNGIRGRFPAEIFQLQNLRYLAMNSNVMTGLLPNMFGNLRYLRYLRVDRNVFNGPLPSLQDSPALVNIYLGANELSGTIPSDLLSTVPRRSAVTIDLSSNRLEGSIPDALARFDHLQLDLTQNKFTSIPAALCEKEAWNDGAVGKYGCDAILCPARTVNAGGRRQDGMSCQSCRQNDEEYLGQAMCGSSSGSREKSFVLVIASAIFTLHLLWQ